MVTKSKQGAKGKVKVDDLNLNKETVKDLADSEAKEVKGGAKPGKPPESACAKGCLTWTHSYCPKG